MSGALLFFDIDGTLLTEGEHRYIPDSAITAIHQARSKGNYAFINTGRCIVELDSILPELGVDGMICGCGTYILYHDEVIFHHQLTEELRHSVVVDLDACRLEGLLEGECHIYYGTEEYVSRMDVIRREHRRLIPELIRDMRQGIPSFDKFCFCKNEDSDFERFYEKYKKEFTFIDRGRGFYEVVPAVCSKASGMEFLLKYLQIPIEATYAFGDSANDIPMLEFAHTGIIMGSHDKETEAFADYVTDTVEADGIAKAMEHFGLI